MNYSTLISGEELAGRLSDPDLRIFDCRHQLSDAAYGEKAYAEGHLPGAYFLHLDRDLSGPMNGRNGRHPLPDPQRLARTLGSAGVSRATQVVAYDDAGGMIAGRLWWLLRWLGHDAVAVLDGDWRGWNAENAGNLDRRELCLIDARAADRFRGENETLDPVGGHIPGARNRFFRDNLDDQACFRPAADLRQAFLELLAGVEPDKAVMQCGSGVTACQNLLAMEIAGLPGARLYAGSWSAWCADPSRPVER